MGPERWHVTLAFLGELSAGQRRRLAEGLRPLAAATAPLPARLAAGGTFPAVGRARVLWVGVVCAGLDSLVQALRTAAVGARIPLEPQAFQPHITVARAHHGVAPSDVPHLLRKLSVADGAAWEISRVVLLESSGDPHLAYTELAGWPLTGLVGAAELPTGDEERP